MGPRHPTVFVHHWTYSPPPFIFRLPIVLQRLVIEYVSDFYGHLKIHTGGPVR